MMNTEVLIRSPSLSPVAAAEFNFDSACTSPYITAPSSPARFGTPFFISAPTSPTRGSSAFYNAFNNSLHGGGSSGASSFSSVPFIWEQKPGTPKFPHHNDDENTDFAFDFSGELERNSLTADELFHGGKIKPLKPPPRLQYENKPENSRSQKKTFKEAFSPRCKKKDVDPFAAAIENTRTVPPGTVQRRLARPVHKDENTRTTDSSSSSPISTIQDESKNDDHQRGRERNPNSSSFRHKATRSLSPFRASDLLFDRENDQQKPTKTSFSSSWYRKWKIKDLLLFRSASEGRTTSTAQLKNYDDVKNSSFRSTDSFGSSVSSSKRRSSASISAHELHYTINRAVSEEMKKKTFLPYKQGLLGCLGFNPAVNEISKGIGSMSRG